MLKAKLSAHLTEVCILLGFITACPAWAIGNKTKLTNCERLLYHAKNFSDLSQSTLGARPSTILQRWILRTESFVDKAATEEDFERRKDEAKRFGKTWEGIARRSLKEHQLWKSDISLNGELYAFELDREKITQLIPILKALPNDYRIQTEPIGLTIQGIGASILTRTRTLDLPPLIVSGSLSTVETSNVFHEIVHVLIDEERRQSRNSRFGLAGDFSGDLQEAIYQKIQMRHYAKKFTSEEIWAHLAQVVDFLGSSCSQSPQRDDNVSYYLMRYASRVRNLTETHLDIVLPSIREVLLNAPRMERERKNDVEYVTILSQNSNIKIRPPRSSYPILESNLPVLATKWLGELQDEEKLTQELMQILSKVDFTEWSNFCPVRSELKNVLLRAVPSLSPHFRRL